MKVRGLNEAKYNTVQMAEEAYNAAYDSKGNNKNNFKLWYWLCK